MLKYLLIVLSLLLALAIWYRAAAATEGPILLYDEGHGQQFVAGGTGPLDLSELTGILRGQGLVPRSHVGPFDDTALAGVSALIVSGPFVPFAEGEIAALRHFVEEGGTLVVMLHVGPPLAGLLHAFGVDFSNGVIRETADLLADEPLNFRVSRLESHALLACTAAVRWPTSQGNHGSSPVPGPRPGSISTATANPTPATPCSPSAWS